MSLILRQFLQKLIQSGSLEVFPADAPSFMVGDGSPPSCAIEFTDREAERALALDPELAFGELYMDGRLKMVSGEIFDLLALASSNFAAQERPPRLALLQRLRWARMRLRRINPWRARENVAHHYDLDGRLYDLFLDRDRQYSCAYFEAPDMGLDAAQTAKKRHITAKLAVEPGQEILDIGCGWGGLAIYLAGLCDAEVLGVTLSTEQLDLARQKAEQAGLAAKVRFDLLDYRQVGGRFDRIVSVGMFEHVGPKHYDAFFGQISRLLSEKGVALVHTIAHFGEPAPTNPWVRKYIFPDGHIPAFVEIAPALARAGLVVADMETLRGHYVRTVEHWRARFAAQREKAQSLYGERFCRMWEFYLAASECGFRYNGCCVVQLQLVKRFDALPVTRAYIAEAEQQLLRREEASDRFSEAAE